MGAEKLQEHTSKLFTLQDAWTGGHYEVAIELGDWSDDRAATALEQLWKASAVDGCYLLSGVEAENQTRVSTHNHLEDLLYGVATLPNGTKAPCGSYLCRFQDGSDWLGLYLPLSFIARGYPVGGYPFEDWQGYADWQRDIDKWLIDVAKHVFKKVEFQFALIGFELDFGHMSAKKITQAGIPKERFQGFLWPAENGLKFYPANSPVFNLEE